MKILLAVTGCAAGAAAVPVLAILAVLGGSGGSGVPLVPGASATPAVETARALVGASTGWHRLCDRLACRAYGYRTSGYQTALLHWTAMVATGQAHPGDRCPPPGAFVFWSTTSGEGHVAIVSASDGYCDPGRIWLVSNDVLDRESGTTGGVYEVTLSAIESGFVSQQNFLGWSQPVCAGELSSPTTPR